jgi:hypothetical protein
MTASEKQNPDTIERDIERTQYKMGDTVQKIEEKLSPRTLARSLLSDDHADNAREAWTVVRKSPLPVAMIAGGAAWLFATSDAPMISRLRDQLKARFKNAVGSGGSSDELRPRSDEPAPIGPPPERGAAYDRRAGSSDDF